MNAAIAKARATLDDFLRLHARPPVGTSDFKLKVQITDAHGTEHMWVMPFSVTAHGFSGVVDNDPDYVTSVRFGQRINFIRSDISDWGYVRDGKQIGNFTVCAAFKHMPVAEVEQYRHDYGFQCSK